jgi:SOUL heme-binding protein
MQTDTRKTSLSHATAPEVTEVVTHPQTRVTLRKSLFYGLLAAVPAIVGVGVATLLGSKRAGAIAGGATALGLGLARWQLQRVVNDEPAYEVEQRIGHLEIRRYAPYVIAETTIQADGINTALETGFERLFEYIRGGNHDHEKLPMTSPVCSTHLNGGYAVSFVMPMGRALRTLPRPDDSRIELVDMPARRVAVLTYRGRYNAEAIELHELELADLVAAAKLTSTGKPMFAGFDPPSTLPAIRRNEIWIDLA